MQAVRGPCPDRHPGEYVCFCYRENRNRLTQIMLLKSLLQVSPFR